MDTQGKHFSNHALHPVRGEIRWADLSPASGREQTGRRPVLVLNHEIFNRRSGTVIAMAITGQPQRTGFPLTLLLESEELPKRSWVKIGQVRTLSTRRIGERLDHATAAELDRIVEGLCEIIGP